MGLSLYLSEPVILYLRHDKCDRNFMEKNCALNLKAAKITFTYNIIHPATSSESVLPS